MQLRRIRTLGPVMGLLLTLIVGCAATQAPTAPESVTDEAAWQFHDIVDAAFVAPHIAFPMPENVMLIDSRPKHNKYDPGHIPMAVNIPDSQFDKMVDMLPKDRKALLIFYCGGLHCKLSHKSARKAEALGYTNVKVFAEGFPGWMKIKGNYAGVSADWVKQQIDAQAEMVVVDSRPKRTKYDKGHIPTAISIPDSAFDQLKAQLPQNKDKLLVFYCGGYHCKLSHKSAAKAIALGYTNVKVFAGGYPAWQAMAGTATKTQAAAGRLQAGKQEGSIDIALFKKIVAENPRGIYLVDVRDKDEFAAGSLKTAVNIPVDELEKKIPALPADKPIVFICGTGARSGESFYMVQDLRPELKEVYYLDCELTIRKDGTFTTKEPI